MNNQIFPVVNKFLHETSSGRDFLGQQSIIQVMANECIPSFTNSTIRLRYYSFWAWAFQMLKNNFNKLPDDKRWFYLQKLETAFIISNHLRQPGITGMPGINSITIPDRIADKKKDIKIYTEKNRITNSFTPVQYRPSLNYLNIVSKEGTKYAIGHYGSQLAEVFDNVIKQCDGYFDLIDPGKKCIKLEKLICLEEALSLDNVLEQEIPIFIDLIEQKERSDSQRIPTTLLLLDIIMNNKIDSPWNILRPLWNNEYKPNDNLIEVEGAWLIIQVRRYYQYSIEAILHSFLNYLSQLHYGIGNFTDFCKALYRDFIDNAIIISAKEIIKSISDNKPLYIVVNEIYNYLKKEEINEDRLIDEGYNYRNHKNIFTIAQLGILIQFILVRKYSEFQNHSSKIANKFISIPGNFKHSYFNIQNIYKEYSNIPFSEALEKIILELVFILHLGVSQIKWNQTGNFSYKFIKADEYGYSRPDVRNININMANHKVRAYLSLLKDLGFWKDYKGYMTITKEGKKYYDSKINSYFQN